ncbi:uncharacterized protein PRCAT00004844001 [Priceomyces carsonii]|uniref:uncharacterized protein n=1 Tax=Priceomyces carsonii TaxID=28549 RepID=UPI002EDA6DB6|nr:unnamed protein product [Priceomyces carsonii]
MNDYIPDSEGEEEFLLLPSFVSKEKLRRVLSNLNVNERNEATKLLMKSKFSEALVGSESNTAQLDTIQDGVTIAVQNDIDEDMLIENNSRRGLRKRKFSSTHPYLADQAEWLGLMSIGRLNEVYQENQNMDDILKFLNRLYLNKKALYPSEEKYKAKNFYSYLGRGAAGELEMGHGHDGTANIDSTLSSQHSINLEKFQGNVNDFYSDLEDSLFEPPVRTHRINVVEEDEEYDIGCDANRDLFGQSGIHPSSDSDSLEEITVRVGGRLRKEKNILRGVLPESAKRLELYKNASRKRNQERKREIEHRKGLAIRKKALPSKKISSRDLEDTFLDENTYYQNEEMHPIIYSQLSDSNSSRSKTARESESEIDSKSEISSESGNDSECSVVSLSQSMPSLKDSYFESRDYRYNTLNFDTVLGDQPNNKIYSAIESDDYDSVTEWDVVNPMYAYETKRQNRKSHSTTRKSSTVKINRRRKQNRNHITNSKRKGEGRNPFNRSFYQKRGVYDRMDSLKFGLLKKKSLRIDKSKLDTPSKSLERGMMDPIKTLTNPKELLSGEYQFLRDPNVSTIALEAESKSKYVKDKKSFSSTTRSHLQMTSTSLELNSVHQGLMNDRLRQIVRLKQGENVYSKLDCVAFLMQGTRYSFTLVDKRGSKNQSDRLLSHILQLVRNSNELSNSTLFQEVSSGVCNLIDWYLVLQEAPGLRSWKVSRSILNELLHFKDLQGAESKLKMFPLFFMLYYLLCVLSMRDDAPFVSRDKSKSHLEDFAIRFWSSFFDSFRPEYFHELTTEYEKNDKIYTYSLLYIMFAIFQEDTYDWWQQINEAQMKSLASNHQKLEAVYFLATFVPKSHSNWLCFYEIYDRCKLENNSIVHNHFLDIVYSLTQLHRWNLEERLIILIYSSITSRKFSNFDDEWIVPDFIGRVKTRDDIPETSFFERFMHLLYSFVSSIPHGTNQKKLITKLFISSHYNYQKDKRHFIMFINRLNFVILLLQLSAVDLKNQLNDLIKQVAFSNDIGILDLSVDGIAEYTKIVAMKGFSTPFESYLTLINAIIPPFNEVPGILKIWTKLMRVLETSFLKEKSGKGKIDMIILLSDLNLKSLPERASQDLCALLLNTLNELSRKETTHKSLDYSLDKINDQILKLLHSYMGRLPLQDKLKEQRIERSVEILIQIWIRCTYTSTDQNWNVLVFQKYPYLGNSHLRERFAALFFSELLKFTKLEQCMDNVISCLMLNLASYSTSKYLPQLLTQLTLLRSELLTSLKLSIYNSGKFFQADNFKLQLVKDIFSNLSESRKIPPSVKKAFIEEFMKKLNVDYDHHYSSTWFSSFCRTLIEYIHKRLSEMVLSSNHYKRLCSKLGILVEEHDSIDLNTLPMKERLRHMHLEVISAILLKKDSKLVLNKFMSNQNSIVTYHLISIYCKAINLNEPNKWILISYLLDCVWSSFKGYELSISEPNFKEFFFLLIDIPALKNDSQSFEFYRFKAMDSVFRLCERIYLRYDGYKDQVIISEMIHDALKCHFIRNNNRACTFSPYQIVDIQESGIEFPRHASPEQLEEDTLQVKSLAEQSYDRLNILSNKQSLLIMESLYFDF